jgi:heme O synthase-like polyprenyltransferase
MKSFISACVVAVVLAVGAAFILNGVNESATDAYSSRTGARV